MAIDHGWDALVEATNANISEERGALNRALSQIREQSELEGEELGREITYRAVLYREVWPEMSLTATALSKHWGRLPVEHERMQERVTEDERKKKRGVNLRAHNDCATCLGNGWVTVGWRKPVQTSWMAERNIKPSEHPDERGFEEVAACPVCGPTQYRAQFWASRNWAYGPHPGEVELV